MPLNLENLIDQLEDIRKHEDLSKEAFAIKELDVAGRSYKRWTLEEGEPNTKNLRKIIDYIEKNKPEWNKGVKQQTRLVTGITNREALIFKLTIILVYSF